MHKSIKMLFIPIKTYKPKATKSKRSLQKIRRVNRMSARIGLSVQRARYVSYIVIKQILKKTNQQLKTLSHPCQMLVENFTKKPNLLFFCC